MTGSKDANKWRGRERDRKEERKFVCGWNLSWNAKARWISDFTDRYVIQSVRGRSTHMRFFSSRYFTRFEDEIVWDFFLLILKCTFGLHAAQLSSSFGDFSLNSSSVVCWPLMFRVSDQVRFIVYNNSHFLLLPLFIQMIRSSIYSSMFFYEEKTHISRQLKLIRIKLISVN